MLKHFVNMKDLCKAMKKMETGATSGDALTVLKKMPNEFVDTIVTSPPYWSLRDYGESTKVIWDGDKNCKHNFDKVILRKYHKAGETNPGKEGYTKDVGALGQSSGQFCFKCGAWYGQLGLEPTIGLYIKHLLMITIELKRVLKPTGVMFWNHGDCYGGISKKFMPKCLVLQNYRLILRMIDEQGWILRNTIIWHKPNHMPSSVKDRFANSYEPVFMLVKQRKYWFNLDAVRKPHKQSSIERAKYPMNPYGDQGTGVGCAMTGSIKGAGQRKMISLPEGGKNPADVWQIPTHSFSQAHFATFPEKLVEPMIKSSCPQWICKKCGKARVRIIAPDEEYAKSLGSWTKDTDKSKALRDRIGFQARTKKKALTAAYQTLGWTDCNCKAGWRGGIVLDPFAGAGIVAVVAKSLGRQWLGIELNPDYIKIAEKRIANTQGRLL